MSRTLTGIYKLTAGAATALMPGREAAPRAGVFLTFGLRGLAICEKRLDLARWQGRRCASAVKINDAG